MLVMKQLQEHLDIALKNDLRRHDEALGFERSRYKLVQGSPVDIKQTQEERSAKKEKD